jgi:3',5'-cyclic AMP phosphodiesterase CpdA
VRLNLLHLSDLHLAIEAGRNPLGPDAPRIETLSRALGLNNRVFGTYNKDIARAAADFTFKYHKQFDAIIITGDIATTGVVEDLRVAETFVDGPAIRGVSAHENMPTIAASELPIFLIPGNHDRYDTVYGGPGGKKFDQVFKKYWPPGKRVHYVTFEGAEDRLAVVGADFSLRSSFSASPPGPLGWLGQGKVDRKILRSLVETTQGIQRQFPRIGIIWSIHFPPRAPGVSNTLRLIGAEFLIESAKKCNISHIISGHIHSDLSYSLGTRSFPLTVHCAHSVCSASDDDENGFQILEISVRGPGKVSVNPRRYRYNDIEAEFEEA